MEVPLPGEKSSLSPFDAEPRMTLGFLARAKFYPCLQTPKFTDGAKQTPFFSF